MPSANFIVWGKLDLDPHVDLSQFIVSVCNYGREGKIYGV